MMQEKQDRENSRRTDTETETFTKAVFDKQPHSPGVSPGQAKGLPQTNFLR